MPDNLSKEHRRKAMQAVKSSRTKFEDRVSKELWRRGFRFRRNVRDLLGNPDIAVKKYKVAVFLDSCFWHGCSEHSKMPEKNRDYWVRKIERNKERDRKVTESYIEANWHVFRVWEHELKTDFEGSVDEIAAAIESEKRYALDVRET